jgi:hypothetical protein
MSGGIPTFASSSNGGNNFFGSSALFDNPGSSRSPSINYYYCTTLNAPTSSFSVSAWLSPKSYSYTMTFLTLRDASGVMTRTTSAKIGMNLNIATDGRITADLFWGSAPAQMVQLTAGSLTAGLNAWSHVAVSVGPLDGT